MSRSVSLNSNVCSLNPNQYVVTLDLHNDVSELVRSLHTIFKIVSSEFRYQLIQLEYGICQPDFTNMIDLLIVHVPMKSIDNCLELFSKHFGSFPAQLTRSECGEDDFPKVYLVPTVTGIQVENDDSEIYNVTLRVVFYEEL